MIARLRRLWAAAPVATVILALALVAAGVFTLRMAVSVAYWSNPAKREQPLAGWMTPGYIAHSWQVPRGVILEALDAPMPPVGGPMDLDELAALHGTTTEALIAAAEAAIARYRAETKPGPAR